MILEVLEARSGAIRTRLRLEVLPFTIGRGYGNDLILDDPYVDAQHARIALDDGDGLVVEDLGSLNGLVTPCDSLRWPRVEVRAGAEVRVGRTMLRFRGPDEPVPPALPDRAHAAGGGGVAERWPAHLGWSLAVSAVAMAAVALSAWFGSFDRASASNMVSSVLGLVFLGALWAGAWAIASRVNVHRFHFLGHFAVASAAVLAGLLFAVASEWMMFLFPDSPMVDVAGTVAGLVVLAALVAGHLALASALSRRRRWRAGLLTGTVLLGIGGAAALAEDDSFSDVPEFSGMLKPVGVSWLRAGSVDGFSSVALDLKEEVDALAEED